MIKYFAKETIADDFSHLKAELFKMLSLGRVKYFYYAKYYFNLTKTEQVWPDETNFICRISHILT